MLTFEDKCDNPRTGDREYRGTGRVARELKEDRDMDTYKIVRHYIKGAKIDGMEGGDK